MDDNGFYCVDLKDWIGIWMFKFYFFFDRFLELFLFME